MRIPLGITIVLLFGRGATACSLAITPPSEVDSALVAFRAVVVGYPTSAVPVLGTAHPRGLALRVTEALLSAPLGPEVIEVYLTSFGSDCETVALDPPDLHAKYPAG